MLNERAAGVLCHISSLPSRYGIGDLGPEAYRFVDILAQAGQKYWQVLPLNPTDDVMGNSPYSSSSAFAFNILFISPDLLAEDGLLEKEYLRTLKDPVIDKVDHGTALLLKEQILSKAWETYRSRKFKWRSFERFCRHESDWLQDFARFVVLKDRFKDVLWVDWPVEFRDRDQAALNAFDLEAMIKIDEIKFQQFLFFKQWQRLQQYCSGKNIGLIGDIPIYVNYDSVDVWVHPDIFKLGSDKKPVVVAGVPPDYFSENGQRWGNPVYDWKCLAENGFEWWVKRIQHNLSLFDAARIDHFRAFAQCWEIPFEEKTAVNGSWVDVPGEALFDVLQEKFPKLPIIAEDLGIITPDVDALKGKFRLPGMRVVMFAFHNEYKKSRDLPENYVPQSVVYTGTHDNNTLLGWLKEDITPIEKKNMKEYFGYDISVEEGPWLMIEMVLRSVSSLAIIPLQDILSLDGSARMNKPSTTVGNWKWRFQSGAFRRSLVNRLKEATLAGQR